MKSPGFLQKKSSLTSSISWFLWKHEMHDFGGVCLSSSSSWISQGHQTHSWTESLCSQYSSVHAADLTLLHPWKLQVSASNSPAKMWMQHRHPICSGPLRKWTCLNEKDTERKRKGEGVQKILEALGCKGSQLRTTLNILGLTHQQRGMNVRMPQAMS